MDESTKRCLIWTHEQFEVKTRCSFADKRKFSSACPSKCSPWSAKRTRLKAGTGQESRPSQQRLGPGPICSPSLASPTAHIARPCSSKTNWRSSLPLLALFAHKRAPFRSVLQQSEIRPVVGLDGFEQLPIITEQKSGSFCSKRFF
jgi:hypothetical protein